MSMNVVAVRTHLEVVRRLMHIYSFDLLVDALAVKQDLGRHQALSGVTGRAE